MSVQFFVPGKPEPAGSKRAFVPKGWTRPVITDANKKSKPWKDTVTNIALQNYRGELMTGPLRVTFKFQVWRPQGHYGTGKNGGIVKRSSPLHPAVKPDVLKLARGVEDALTSIIWKDDAQIVDEHILKEYVEPNIACGVFITVQELLK